jgi:hypothetical protein
MSSRFKISRQTQQPVLDYRSKRRERSRVKGLASRGRLFPAFVSLVFFCRNFSALRLCAFAFK